MHGMEGAVGNVVVWRGEGQKVVEEEWIPAYALDRFNEIVDKDEARTPGA